MEKRDSNYQSIGICQKLFNFFMNNLIAPGIKRITTPASHESTGVPVEEGSRNREQPVKPTKSPGREGMLHPAAKGKPKDNTSSEVIVEFRHTSGDQIQLQNKIEQRKKEKENDLAAQSGVKISNKRQIPLDQEIGHSKGATLSQVQEKTGSQVQDEGLRGLQPPSTAIESHVSSPKKITGIRDNVGEKEKGKNIPTENQTPATGPIYRKRTVPEDRNTKPQRPGRLLSVTSNINEKSDAFITITRKNFE